MAAREDSQIRLNPARRTPLKSTYFQEKTAGLVQPSDVQVKRDGERVEVQWNTALAGAEPIRSYEVRAGDRVLLTLPFRPQGTEAPLSVFLPGFAVGSDTVTVVASELPPRRKA